MNENPSLARLRLISDDELDREFVSEGHGEATRQAILVEQLRRLRTAPTSRFDALRWATFMVALVGAVFAGIAAYPVFAGMFEREWFDF